MKLPRKIAFAVEAVLDIALNSASGPVASVDITDRLGIPRRYLEQVLQQLVRAGILTGTRGPRGGYRLAMERRRITVAAVLRAVGGDDGPDGLVGGSGSPLGEAVVGPAVETVLADCMQRLDGITMDHLCRRAVECGVHVTPDGPVDFSI